MFVPTCLLVLVFAPVLVVGGVALAGVAAVAAVFLLFPGACAVAGYVAGTYSGSLDTACMCGVGGGVTGLLLQWAYGRSATAARNAATLESA